MSGPGFNTAGGFMAGARDRLLPPSLTYRFFATAIVAHLLAWGVLVAAGGEMTAFGGGPGPVLAALHLITLGVLVMTAMGAAYQILPVATHQPLGPVWVCALSWWLFAPGVGLMALGFGVAAPHLQQLGAVGVVGGLALFTMVVGRAIGQGGSLAGLRRFTAMALGVLAALAALGLLLIADWSMGILSDHQAVAGAHAVLAGYGFMGFLALGFSSVLVPMFALSSPLAETVLARVAWLAATALLLGVLGVLVWPPLAGLGAVVGLGALSLQGRAMHQSLKGRMKRRLEPFFRLVGLGAALLVVSLVLGAAVALGAGRLAPLWVFVLVFGWLLSFVLGFLQRIMPFLASMHTSLTGGKVALVSRLAAPLPLTIHLWAHGAALALMGAGLAFELPLLGRLGALAGLTGALSYGCFAFELGRRWRRHVRDHLVPKDVSSC